MASSSSKASLPLTAGSAGHVFLAHLPERELMGAMHVVEGGRVTTVDTDAVYTEVAALMPEFMRMLERAYATSRRLEPVLWQVYERCHRETSEMNRFATPPSEWGAWGSVRKE
jgi:hypothetical protein